MSRMWIFRPTITGQPRGPSKDGDADAGKTNDTGRLPALDVPAGWAGSLFGS